MSTFLDAALGVERDGRAAVGLSAEEGRVAALGLRLWLRLQDPACSDRARLTERELAAVDHRASYSAWEHSEEAAAIADDGGDPQAVKAEVDQLRREIVERAQREGWLEPPAD